MPRGTLDPDYYYSSEEQVRLARNLAALYSDLAAGGRSSDVYRVELICSWHGRLFDDVRDHAGRHRSSSFGPETLVFGPNRSPHRDEVPTLLDEHCRRAAGLIREVEVSTQAPSVTAVDDAIRVAAYIHADLIRIHPFIDGNGRVARLVMDWTLLRVSFPFTIAFHIPAEEYRSALNHYYFTGDIRPLADLVLRAYSFVLR